MSKLSDLLFGLFFKSTRVVLIIGLKINFNDSTQHQSYTGDKYNHFNGQKTKVVLDVYHRLIAIIIYRGTENRKEK